MSNCEACELLIVEAKLCGDCQIEHEMNLADAMDEINTQNELYHWEKI